MFENLDALNAWLERRCIELWSELRHPQRREFTIRELWEQERGTLMAAPSAFDGFVAYSDRTWTGVFQGSCPMNFLRPNFSSILLIQFNPVNVSPISCLT